MPGSKYRLTYFPIKGRGELIRLVFYASRVPFVDRRIPFAEWSDFKSKNPSGTLPMLEINSEAFEGNEAITNWASHKFGLMGKTDAEELKTNAIVIQATDLRETFIIPLIMGKDPEKREDLKKQLEEAVKEVFTKWEANVVQTESTGRKVFSYMVTQCMTVADLALLYVADLAQDYITVDWTSFPRLHAVIKTVSDLPHIKVYLTNRDNPESTSKPQTTPRPQPDTPRTRPTQKQPPSPTKSVATPRAKGLQSVKQA